MIIWAIARTTLGDALRKKILQIFMAITIGMIILSLSFSQTLSFSSRTGAGADLMLLKSRGLGLMAISGVLISVILGIGLIPQEIERKTIYTILAKPVRRYEFIIGKFLGAILTLAINVGLMGLVYIVVVYLKAYGAEQLATQTKDAAIGSNIMNPVHAFDIKTVYSVIMMFMQVMILSSVVLFFSTFFTPMVNFVLGIGVYILGTMAAVTETLGHAEGASKGLQLLYKLIYVIVPNFDKFNVTNELIHPDSVNIHLGQYTLGLALYSIIYTLIMMTAAVIVFDRKEV